MSQEDVNTLERLYQAWNDRDVDGLRAYADWTAALEAAGLSEEGPG